MLGLVAESSIVSKQITRVWHECIDLLLAHINIIQIPFTDPFCLLILALHDSQFKMIPLCLILDLSAAPQFNLMLKQAVLAPLPSFKQPFF